MWFIEWLRHKFAVHCDVCETKVKCESCEVLKEQIAQLYKQNQQLLDRLCILPEMKIEESASTKELKPITTYVPYRMRRAQLEQASRIKKERLDQAELEKIAVLKAPKPIDELEEELGIADATTSSNS